METILICAMHAKPGDLEALRTAERAESEMTDVSHAELSAAQFSRDSNHSLSAEGKCASCYRLPPDFSGVCGTAPSAINLCSSSAIEIL